MSKVRRAEEVKTDARRAMTPARKHRIWLAWDGKCCLCGEPVEESGPGVIYEHIGVLWITGSDADEDIGPAHKACADDKTKGDLSRIAKTKRQRKAHLGEKTPSKRPIQSRGFDKSKSRGFDGSIRPRKQHHRERNDRDERHDQDG